VAVRFFRLYKTMSYRGQPEEVTNIYMYDGWDPAGSGADSPGAIRDIEGQILDVEKTLHSNKVTFLRVESGLVRPPKLLEKYPVAGLVDYERLYPQPALGAVNELQSEATEFTVMVQNRISKLGWLRKYYHRCAGTLVAGATGTDPWIWSAGIVGPALLAIKGLNELAEVAGVGKHVMCNSRGTQAQEAAWAGPDRAVFHEIKY
jgi:hypothetical protein